MLTTTKSPDQVKQDQSPLMSLIMEPGSRMDLTDFFDRWVPKLYGIHKYDRLAQWGRDFRTGDRVALTWRQACLKEIQCWGISLDSARNWGTGWEKATDMARRYAYIMDAALHQEKLSEATKRKTIGN